MKNTAVKALVISCLAGLFAVAAAAGPRPYRPGKILSFDTGQQRAKNAKKAAKDELVYQVQIESVVYKITNHTKKQEFSAGDEVQCRVDKTHLVIQKSKGGEVKYEILGESSQSEHTTNTTP
jgi:hypothetical protein